MASQTTASTAQQKTDPQVYCALQEFILRGGTPSFRAQQMIRSRMQQSKDYNEEADALTQLDLWLSQNKQLAG